MMTYSDFSAGSEPSNMPATLVDSIVSRFNAALRLQRAGKREPRQRLAVRNERGDLVERVTGAVEDRRRAARASG